MRQFIAKTALFSLIIVAILLVIEVMLMDVPNIITTKSRYIKEYPDSIKTMILGNSHSHMGIVPEELDAYTFNNSYYGKCPYYDYHMLKDESETLQGLTCVIWNISYNLHEYNTQYIKDYKRDFQKYAINKLLKYYGIEPIGGIPYIFWWETIWTSYEGPVIMRLVNKVEFDYTDKGWVALTRAERPDDWEAQKKIPEGTTYGEKEKRQAVEENIHYAMQIAEICKAKGIRLIVVTMPCHSSSTRNACDEGMADIYACVDSMKKVYPDVEYHNYFTDSRFEDDDFYDSTHLCAEGARKFTRIFKEEIYDKTR